MIVQGLAPMSVKLSKPYLFNLTIIARFVGAFADNGHRPAFLVCNVIYIIANVALALQNSYTALILLRMLQSAGSSGTIALRNGVIASIFTPAERGGYLSVINAASLWAPGKSFSIKLFIPAPETMEHGSLSTRVRKVSDI